MDEYTKRLLEAMGIAYKVKLILYNESQKHLRQAVKNLFDHKSIAEDIKEHDFWYGEYLNEHYKPLERFMQ